MYPAEFEYFVAPSLEGAVALLEEHGDEAKLLAGGQSLIPMMNLRLLLPTALIDISRLPVGEIRVEGDELVIPAGVRHRELIDHPLIHAHAPAIAEAARCIGNVRVRTRGTIGGSIAHADPSAELPCVLTALGATAEVLGTGGTRAVAADDFFDTYLTTTLEHAEIVTAIRLPVPGRNRGQAFVEFVRRAGDFALVEVAADLEIDGEGRCTALSLVYGGVADRPVVLEDAAMLVGETPTSEASARVAVAARERLDPNDDVHGSATLRKRLVESLTRAALETAHSRAKDN